jgi:hypothetical protein
LLLVRLEDLEVPDHHCLQQELILLVVMPYQKTETSYVFQILVEVVHLVVVASLDRQIQTPHRS